MLGAYAALQITLLPYEESQWNRDSHCENMPIQKY